MLPRLAGRQGSPKSIGDHCGGGVEEVREWTGVRWKFWDHLIWLGGLMDEGENEKTLERKAVLAL
jgi:hypothetical protein